MALPKVTLHYHTLEVSPYYLVANIVTSKKVRGVTQTIKSINFLDPMRTEITKFPGNLITLHTPGNTEAVPQMIFVKISLTKPKYLINAN